MSEKNREEVTKERNKQIIIKYAAGASLNELAAEYGLAKSTVSRIANQKDNFPFLQVMFKDYNFSGYAYVKNFGITPSIISSGMANYEKNIPLTKDTRFAIGRCTRLFTALCVMILQDRGLISVEDNLDKYIPEYTEAKYLTIRKLLDGSSGISLDGLNEFGDKLVEEFESENNDKDELNVYAALNKIWNEVYTIHSGKLDDILKYINNIPLNTELSELGDFGYIDYKLLGIVVERVSGQTLEQFMSDNIFVPLKMSKTSTKSKDSETIGYYNGTECVPTDYFGGDCGIISTVSDMLKLLYSFSLQSLLSKESYDIMLTPNTNNYCFGVQYVEEKGYYIFEKCFGIYIDMMFNREGVGDFVIRNKAPIPDNHMRIVYYTVKGCNDGKAKLKVMKMEPGADITVYDISVYDGRMRKEIYSVKKRDKKAYILNVKNDREEAHEASELYNDDSKYTFTIDLKKIVGDDYDPEECLIIRVKAYSEKTAKLGLFFEQEGKSVYNFFNIFDNYVKHIYTDAAFDALMEAMKSYSDYDYEEIEKSNS